MSLLNSIFNLLRFNRRNWRAVVLCFFAAAVFWIFNAFNKRYTTNVNFPVAFDYNEENYVAVRPLPEEVRLNVTGVGWNLFRRTIGLKVPPLVIPLERPAEIQKIVGGTLPALFANQLEGYEINFVLTDTLHVALEPRSKRWVTLRLDTAAVLFRKGYKLVSDPVIEPDSIYIEGPWKLLDSIEEPINVQLPQRNIDEDFKNDVEVIFPNNELITRNPPTVMVRFEVDKLVEIRDSVQLQLINIPKGARPAINSSLPCVLAIPREQLEKFQLDSLRAVVDLKGFLKGERKILPHITGLPPYSEVVRVDSVRVKF
jgi:YbbR domain-containing protein